MVAPAAVTEYLAQQHERRQWEMRRIFAVAKPDEPYLGSWFTDTVYRTEEIESGYRYESIANAMKAHIMVVDQQRREMQAIRSLLQAEYWNGAKWVDVS